MLNLCNARLFVPATMDEALSYQQKQEYMWKVIKELADKVNDLEARVEVFEKKQA